MPFRFTSALPGLSAADRRLLMERAAAADERVKARTAAILARVRREGDVALRQLAHELDGVMLETLEVDRDARRRALDAVPGPLRRAMERAAANVAAAHRAFLPQATEVETEPGVLIGRRPDPLERVGVYAPGGRAAYPSSVLMGVVPAKIAGVGEVVVCSPPQRETGAPAEIVLAAAELAGADRVFALGGAGAIAALAFGTDSVPCVNRIVGPGNAYVAEAKVQVSGLVPIDSPAGPSELLVVCDAAADARVVAREVLAQAEHDPDAAVVVVALDEATARAVGAEVERVVEAGAPRADIVRASLAARGALLWNEDAAAVARWVSEWAPEHLLLAVADPERALPAYRGAGTVFLGAASSVAFGDYMTGANHVLPTGRAARSYSGLSTLDFVRWTTWQRVSPEAAARLAGDVGAFADAEGLPNHAAAARGWTTDPAGPR